MKPRNVNKAAILRECLGKMTDDQLAKALESAKVSRRFEPKNGLVFREAEFDEDEMMEVLVERDLVISFEEIQAEIANRQLAKSQTKPKQKQGQFPRIQKDWDFEERLASFGPQNG
jgi:hypothetical protein